jgi:hypothetical protein
MHTHPYGNGSEGNMAVQYLSLELDGITAGDYLSWVRDPEPAALDMELCSVAVDADPLGHVIEATLVWNGPAPDPPVAARIAGFPLTAEVASVKAGQLAAVA